MSIRKKGETSLWSRLGWMLVIYLGSVAGLILIASFFKLLMALAGLRSH